ncbi:MAG: ribonuclease J [Ilumatobacteraceae bacterium]|jgi:ribonuclease J|nr:ribonuclease J [Ilumatobacteraceae bacterium]MDP5069079.1 ribonuclease J [Ilumatobacteraceae bacterium]
MAQPVRIYFLGGLGEIGRNCMVLEQDDKLMLIDCGLMFPDADMHGIDLVLPDFTFLRENADRIVGCVATHGHEDHVGGLQFLLRELSFPIYGSMVTLGLARNRIEEAGLLKKTDLITVRDGERINIGPFDVEFLPVTHSVPHAHAVIVHTPQGVIVHSGDFKLDLTPVDDRRTDLARLGELSKTVGIRLLMCDSTNAEEHGHAPSEKSVGAVLHQLFHEHRDRRIITASFASHIHRVQQIIEAAIDNGRKVCLMGRSMQKNIGLAIDLKLINVPASVFVDVEKVDDFAPEDICIISTGSQGEPMAALSLLSRGESRWFKVGDRDTIILSSHAIPGNEGNVNRVIDGLVRAGAKVVHSGIADVHATGHAQADELKTYHSILQPEWFVPVHGEYRHMRAHAELAVVMGAAPDHVLQATDGDVLELSDDGLAFHSTVPASYLFVDGIVGDVGHGVLRDRKVLAEEGVVVIVATVDSSSHKVINGPEVITRGWVYAPEADALLDEAEAHIEKALVKALEDGITDIDGLERIVRKAAGKFVSDRTKRRPMIVPVVMTT